ncbi:2-oxoglutarate dehydrogenase, E2 component, dihydrolipoamide succinyltransferase [Streptomyces lycii]|uniref:Dihydrolipoamide acetyltransferase component of pyruvate dehydrogenase complex n=1 Tax=Streptomyces lycii TaxID=2654337 RepID=A0ABQ7FEI5_9ACTN|nr:2-oxoglutarate dehydrogenase, E2 component, dihydrolipoamide succinyltransferase [Streptomyces lycii]KAF4407235.1 2-oxoglutarate dehydrogenase, E2 component, dihydrolipoamide succinyltransferase [Streptomyces lycii]
MAVSVTLPALGESVTEGTVTRWLKAEGESVEADEPLLEVSTDKVDTEIPAPAAGVLSSIKVAEDETVEVGAELAVIDDGTGGAEEAPAPAAESAPQPEAQPEPEPEPAPAAEAPAPAAPAPSGGGAEGTPVTLPALGESVTEGTVTRWLKEVGESVEADEPLLEVSTDKVDTEIPSPAAGTLLEIVVGEDETAEVGAKLAVIGSADQAAAPAPAPEAPKQEAPKQEAPKQEAPKQEAPAPAPQAPTAPAPQQQETPAPAPVPSAPAPAPAPAATSAAGRPTAPVGGDGAYVTPLVRKLAAEHGVDLSSVKGTGVGGRIRKQDVVAAAEAAKAAAPAAAAPKAAAPVEPSPLRGQTVKMSRVRKATAKHMVESLKVSAQLTTVVEVDVTRVMRLRARAKEQFLAREGVKLSPMPFFVKAVTEALKVHPAVNAKVNDDETITYHDVENIGIAVDTEKGLFVPVIHNAGDLNLAGIAKKTADLANRTRNGGIKPDELSGGTFTVTNTGSRGALFDTPILNQPQVGMLGIGATVKRPVVVNHPDLGETIAVRDMVYLALTYDHRLVDGADAARFLGTLKTRLEEGAFEGDLGL